MLEQVPAFEKGSIVIREGSQPGSSFFKPLTPNKMQILDDVKLLSKRLAVAPLKEGEVAVFRLARAFKKTELRDDPTCPEVAVYPGVEQINDPGETVAQNRPKKIGTRIVDYRQMNGQAVPIYERVKFVRGDCRVGFDNHALYEFMMRSKHSGANRFRKQMGAKNPPTWILVGSDQIAGLLSIVDMKFYAEKMLRDCDGTGLKTVALKLNSSPDARLHIRSYRPGQAGGEDILSIKLELFQKARDYPKQVIYAGDDSASRRRVEVYDAMTMAILFMNDKGEYVILTAEDKEEPLFSPDPGKDAMNSLIEFFENEKGAAAYVKFAAALKRAVKIPA